MMKNRDEAEFGETLQHLEFVAGFAASSAAKPVVRLEFRDPVTGMLLLVAKFRKEQLPAAAQFATEMNVRGKCVLVEPASDRRKVDIEGAPFPGPHVLEIRWELGHGALVRVMDALDALAMVAARFGDTVYGFLLLPTGPSSPGDGAGAGPQGRPLDLGGSISVFSAARRPVPLAGTLWRPTAGERGQRVEPARVSISFGRSEPSSMAAASRSWPADEPRPPATA